jgi:hypothetical protein
MPIMELIDKTFTDLPLKIIIKNILFNVTMFVFAVFPFTTIEMATQRVVIGNVDAKTFLRH